MRRPAASAALLLLLGAQMVMPSRSGAEITKAMPENRSSQPGEQPRMGARTPASPAPALSVDAVAAATIPMTKATALDGHPVTLPQDLPARATVLILGFGRNSQDATTAWERPVRTQLAHVPAVGFYDMAMLAEVPGLIRPLILRAIKGKVPDVLKPNFLPLTDQEDAWKRVAGYVADQPDAAYVLVVDRTGRVQWSTHAGFSQNGFAELTRVAQRVAAESR